MANQHLHLASTAGWRALLTHAQHAADVVLPIEVEEHIVGLLYRYIGEELSTAELENGMLNRFDRIANADTRRSDVVGDQCLLYAGLIPEHVIRKGMPVSYFVQLGQSSYAECGQRASEGLVYAALSREFVHAMDTLQTLRALQSGESSIDGFNAFHLWHDLGSQHSWRVLRSMSAALPASGDVSQLLH